MTHPALVQSLPGAPPGEAELMKLAAAAGLNAFDDVAALRRLVLLLASRCAGIADAHPGRKGTAGDAIRAVYGLGAVTVEQEALFIWPDVIVSQ